MALGLNVFHVTMNDFLDQLHRFDSVKLNDKNEFVCWTEGMCNFYVVDDVHDALNAFAVSVAEQHAAQQIEKICEKCGSDRTTKSEHSSAAYVVYKCDCGHERVISL